MRCRPGEQIGLWAKDRDWLQWLLSTFLHREYLLYKLVPIHPLEELNVFITATQMLNHGSIPKINRWVLYCATQLCFTREASSRNIYVTYHPSVYLHYVSMHGYALLPSDILLPYVYTILIPPRNKLCDLFICWVFFLGSCLTACCTHSIS